MKLVLFINLLIATWMYDDAENRLQYWDKKTKFYTKPWEAFVGGLFLGVIGLIIWFFIRPKKSEIRKQATKNMTVNIKKKERLSLVNKILIAFGILFLILFIGGFIVGFLSTWTTTYVEKSELPSTTTTIILSNTEIVKNIVKEYHKTHTYSKEDFFVCGDMAIDVWNLVKTNGINAKIIIGNIDNPDANFTEYNHVWVLAEVEPFTWLALETTGGYIVYNETNPNYYKGYFFDNPSEFKKYLDLKRKYNAQINRVDELENEYNICVDEYEKLRMAYNENYAGKQVSNEGLEARDKVMEKLGECKTLNSKVLEESLILTNIISEINGLLT